MNDADSCLDPGSEMGTFTDDTTAVCLRQNTRRWPTLLGFCPRHSMGTDYDLH